jgi:hypothetical protein
LRRISWHCERSTLDNSAGRAGCTQSASIRFRGLRHEVGWTPWIDIPDWFSWENQGGSIAVADFEGDGSRDLIVFMIDNTVQAGNISISPDGVDAATIDMHTIRSSRTAH